MSVDELEQPILGKYRVISSITAESSVFTYIANSNIKTVFVRAISATHPDFNPAYLVACLREFEISNQLAGNTGLVSVLEYGSSDDTHYFIYEFIEGGSLHEQIAISRNRPLNNQTIGAVGRDVCNALEVLHSNGLFHGDLNPKNILYNKSKQAFLKSYGTSAIAAEDEDKLGCDIYALGAILYKMATCQQYRPGKSQPALLLNRNLTPALSTIISATLNEFGEKRYYNLALLQEHFGLAIDPDISPEHLLEQLVKPALPEIVLEPLAPEIEESSAEEVVEPELEAEVESSAEEVVEPELEAEVESSAEEVVELELEAEIESSAEEVVELELEAEIESAAEEVVEPELEAEVESAAEEVVELELEAEVEAAEEVVEPELEAEVESAAEVVEPELEAEVEAAEEVVELELEAEVESAEEVVEPELEAEVESVELTEEEAFFAELEREIAAEKAEAARLALEAAELAELERQIAVITVKSEEVVEPELEPEIEAVALIEPELGSRVAAVEEAATLEPEVAAEEILTHELEVEAASNEPIIELDDADLYEALAKNASEIAPTVVEKLSVPTLEPLMSANIAPETKPLEIKNATPILNSLPLPYNSNASELKTKTTRVAQIEVPLVLQHPGVTEVEKPEQKAKYKLRSLSLFIKILILLSAIILLILLVSFSKAPINTVRLVPNTPAPANSSITTLVSSLNIQASTNDVSQPHLGQELITTLPVLFRDSFTPNYNPKWKMFDNKWNVVNGIFKTIDNRPGTLLLDIGAVQNYELALVTESFALTKSLGIYFEVNGEPTNGTLAASKSYISISFFNCSLYDINTKIDGKPALSTSVTTNYTYCNEDTRYAKPIIIQIKANALYIYTSNNNYKLFKTDLPPGVTVGKIGIVSGGVGISDIRIIGL